MATFTGQEQMFEQLRVFVEDAANGGSLRGDGDSMWSYFIALVNSSPLMVTDLLAYQPLVAPDRARMGNWVKSRPSGATTATRANASAHRTPGASGGQGSRQCCEDVGPCRNSICSGASFPRAYSTATPRSKLCGYFALSRLGRSRRIRGHALRMDDPLLNLQG